MDGKKCIIYILSFFVLCDFGFVTAQSRDDLAVPPPATVLPDEIINTIINEISGELPFQHVMETGGYNRDRKRKEYEERYWETEYFLSKAIEYGFSDAHVETFPLGGIEMIGGKKQWDAEIGELWLVEPEDRLIISHRDAPLSLVSGSRSCDVYSELIYVGRGRDDADYSGKDVKGKIIFVDGNPASVFTKGILEHGALGVVGYTVPKEITRVDQISDTRLRIPADVEESRRFFAFNLSYRLGINLKERLKRKERLFVRAEVKTSEYETDEEVITAVIPGDGSKGEEVVLIAHVFEGITKQGAVDNLSSSAAILEAGRTLIKLIKQGKIERPARTIRFLWVPEITGTCKYLDKYPGETKKIIAAINLEMVGVYRKVSMANLHLHRSLYSLASFLDDINEDFFHYVGETNRDIVLNRDVAKYSNPIVAPTGSQDPFYYHVEKNYSPSDHIVFMLPAAHIPAVHYSGWPDVVLHTSEDRASLLDPTQLKRAAFIGAAAAYTIARSKAEDIPRLLSLLYNKSMARIRDEVRLAVSLIDRSLPENLQECYKKARTITECYYQIEIGRIQSLKAFSDGCSWAEELISKRIENLSANRDMDLMMLDEYYELKCEKYSKTPERPELTDEEKTARDMIPVMIISDESLVAQFSAWMKKDAVISGDYAIECLNFVDGKRSVLDIRNLVCTEYKFLPVKAFIDHFKKLSNEESVKIITAAN
ncbi:MAG: M28 family peptidase [Candidatus Aminicenantes bacterium]|nr:M28 family peptidase [Candidatus Aminicenantes bacterium]